MNIKQQEILTIAQEECAEVILAISKIERFGLDSFKPGKPLTNRQHLEVEIGDVMAMFNLMISNGLVDVEKVDIAMQEKIEKLKKWSNIFND